MNLAILVVLVILIVVAAWAMAAYNGLIGMRNRVEEAWAQIDTELKRRHDLIGNLVETVKGYAAHERGTLEDVMTARFAAMAGGQTPAQQAQNEGLLTQALGRLIAVAESYPDLKASQSFLALQQELTATEDRVASARRYYNAVVKEYTTRTQTAPTNAIASLFGFPAKEYFEAEGEDREPARVDFGQRDAAIPPPSSYAGPQTTAPGGPATGPSDGDRPDETTA